MSKPPLVLIAGWGQTSEVFDTLAPALAPFADVCVTSTYELASRWQSSGHPLTDATPPEEISNYCQQLQIDVLTDQPATLVGWSMGGMVALEAANRFAGAAERLILIGCCASFCDREADNYHLGNTTREVERMAAGLIEDHKRTLEYFLRNVYRRAVSKSALATKTQQAMQLDIPTLQHGLAYLRDADLRSLLREIPQPTLILHGDQDRVVPSTATKHLEQSLPRTQVVHFTEGVHGLCEQFPSEVAREIKDFLRHGE